MAEPDQQGELEASPQTAKFFETLLRASVDGIVITDATYNIVLVNEAFGAFFGRRRRDLAETSLSVWLEHLDGDASLRWAGLEKDVRRKGECRDVEFQMTTADSIRYLSVNAFLPAPATDRERSLIISIWRDVTLHRRMEQELREHRERPEELVEKRTAALRESEERFRAVFEQAADSIALFDPESGAIIEFNDRAAENLGYTREEFARLSMADIDALDSADDVARRARSIAEAGADTFETQHVNADGELRDVSVNARAISIRGRRLIAGVWRDITERKRAEEALHRERDFCTSLLQASPTFFVAISADGRTLMMNEAMLDRLGYTKDEAVDTDYLETFVPEADRESLAKVFARLMHQCEPTLNENRVLTKDGRELLVEWRGRPVFKEDGTLDFFFGVGIDITERENAEGVLRESEELLRTVVDATQDAMISIGEDGLITLFNPAAEKMFGRKKEEMLGQPLDCLMPEEYRKLHGQYVKSYFTTGKPDRAVGRMLELPGLRSDGTVFPMDISLSGGNVGDRRFVIAVARDTSERKLLEDQFRQSQKMEALGLLAGGIAHDFNNILTAILGNAEFVLGKLTKEAPSDERYVACLNGIVHAANRAVLLTRQLLAFGRRQAASPVALDLNGVLDGVEELLPWIIGEQIEVIVKREPAICLTQADASQFEQIMMNLVVNARDAMPDGGKLTIETADVTLDEDYVAGHPEAHPGRHAALYVSDTGIGMDSETVRRIFEPFFTTKPPGQGTGLGLSTVFGIVRQAGGHIRVESEEGRGTVFRVYLPVVDPTGSMPAAKPGGGTCIPGEMGGDETILVCENEESIRRLAGEVLEHNGYKVLSAENGRKGLELAKKHPGPIHLLLTDVVLPEMNGLQLTEALRATRPELGALYMAGYSSDIRDPNAIAVGESELLEKPFSANNLLVRVRDRLDTAVQAACGGPQDAVSQPRTKTTGVKTAQDT